MTETTKPVLTPATPTRAALPPTAPAQPVVVEGRPLAPVAGPTGETRAFRLRNGAKHWGPNGAHKAGDVVQLTAAQAEAFADKFEPADAKTEEKDELTRLREENATLRGLVSTPSGNASAPNLPQDIGAKTSIASEQAVASFKTEDLPAKSHVADKAKAVGGETPLQTAGSTPIPANVSATPTVGVPASTVAKEGERS